MAFRDLAEFQLVRPLVLPIRGKVYEFPGDISARGLIKLQKLNYQIEQIRAGVEVEDPISDDEMTAIEAELYGDLKDEMVADGILSSQLKAVFWTLMNYHLAGIEAAEEFWNAQGEAVAPSRAERRRKTPTKSRPSRGSPAGSRTPSPKPQSRPGTRSSSDAS